MPRREEAPESRRGAHVRAPAAEGSIVSAIAERERTGCQGLRTHARTTAPDDSLRPLGRTPGIDRVLPIRGSLPVPTPLVHIDAHVVKHRLVRLQSGCPLNFAAYGPIVNGHRDPGHPGRVVASRVQRALAVDSPPARRAPIRPPWADGMSINLLGAGGNESVGFTQA